MKKSLLLATLLAASALMASVSLPVPGGAGKAQEREPTLAVDAQPSGNTPTAVSTVDPCVSVAAGETFDIDIVMMDVVNLLAWQARFIYDAALLEVVKRDVKLFLASSEGSSVFDVSERLPDDGDGRYLTAAADTADPPAPDSGSGVLARLTLKAKGRGVSPVSLPKIDIDGDGVPDDGPVLTDVDGERIGDIDGDSLFDGIVIDAVVAIDMRCENLNLPGESDLEEDNTTLVVALAAGIAGGFIALAALGSGWLWWRRRSS